MLDYRNIIPNSILLILAIFLAWCIAAWCLSSLVRRRTSRGLRTTLYLSVPFLLIITGISLWQTAVLLKVAATMSVPMLPSNFLISVVFVLLPLILICCSGFPRLWKAARSAHTDPLSDPKMRARFIAPHVSVPIQMALAGSFLAWLIVLFAPSLVAEFVSLVAWLAFGAWRWSRQTRLMHRIIDQGIDAIPRFWPRLARRAGIVVGFVAGASVFIGGAARMSRLPGSYSMNMDMAPGAAMLDMTQLSGPKDVVPDRRFRLTAQKTTVKFGSGHSIEAWTYEGQVPGPELRVHQGDVVEVTLLNKDIEKGVTIHWHGMNVPNAEDGVAGVTQDAVMPGESYVYRFRAVESGTYWYHSHQSSLDQVSKGLFGAFIVEPKGDVPNPADLVVPIHIWQSSPDTPLEFSTAFSSFGTAAQERKVVAPNSAVRLRVINTDSLPRQLSLTGTTFRVAAIDGVDLNQPGDLEYARLVLAAGGRYDLQFTMPGRPVLLSTFVDGTSVPALEASVLLSGDGRGEVERAKTTNDFNPINYGKSLSAAPLPTHFDQKHVFKIDAGGGFMNGQFGLVWSVNGQKFPNLPHIVVHEGQMVKITFINRTFDDHPMHPHGHKMRVLSRNGKISSGSPWWSDTLNVAPGETLEVALEADNPGVWMSHCHNLFHAAEGFVMHLVYENVMTPFKVGLETRNTPE